MEVATLIVLGLIAATAFGLCFDQALDGMVRLLTPLYNITDGLGRHP